MTVNVRSPTRLVSSRPPGSQRRADARCDHTCVGAREGRRHSLVQEVDRAGRRRLEQDVGAGRVGDRREVHALVRAVGDEPVGVLRHRDHLYGPGGGHGRRPPSECAVEAELDERPRPARGCVRVERRNAPHAAGRALAGAHEDRRAARVHGRDLLDDRRRRVGRGRDVGDLEPDLVDQPLGAVPGRAPRPELPGDHDRVLALAARAAGARERDRVRGEDQLAEATFALVRRKVDRRRRVDRIHASDVVRLERLDDHAGRDEAGPRDVDGDARLDRPVVDRERLVVRRLPEAAAGRRALRQRR